MEDFEKWLHTVCFQKPTPEAYDLAKSAWKYAATQEREACANFAEFATVSTQFKTEEHYKIASFIAELIRQRSNV